MSDIKRCIEQIEQSGSFREWIKKNAGAYVCSAVKILGEGATGNWEIHFYNPADDTITTFLVDQTVILKDKNALMLKEPWKKVAALDISGISLNEERTIRRAEMTNHEKYPKEVPTKKIFFLQQTDKPLWNITFIMQSLRMLNMKIDAASGEVQEDSLRGIIERR